MTFQTLNNVMNTLFSSEKQKEHDEIWIYGFDIIKKEWLYKTKNEKNEFEENKTSNIMSLMKSMNERKKIEIKLFSDDILNYDKYKKNIQETILFENLDYKIDNIFELRMDVWGLKILIEKIPDMFASIDRIMVINNMKGQEDEDVLKCLYYIKKCKNFGFFNFYNMEILKTILVLRPNHLFFYNCDFIFEKSYNSILKYLDFQLKSIKINNENESVISLSQLFYCLIETKCLFLQKQKIIDIFNLPMISAFVKNINLKSCDLKNIYKHKSNNNDNQRSLNKIMIHNCDFDLYSIYTLLSNFDSIEKIELKYDKKTKTNENKNLDDILIFILVCYLLQTGSKVNYSEFEKYQLEDVKKNLNILYEEKNSLLESLKNQNNKINNGEYVRNKNFKVYNKKIKNISLCLYGETNNIIYERFIECFNKTI